MKKSLIWLICIMLIIQPFSGVTFAEDESTPEENNEFNPVDTFKIDFDMIRTFSTNDLTYDDTQLSKNDIIVNYKIIPRPIPKELIKQQRKKEIVLVVDGSGSMQKDVKSTYVSDYLNNPKSRMYIVKEALEAFLITVGQMSDVKLGLVVYRDTSAILSPLVDISHGKNYSKFFKNHSDYYQRGIITRLNAGGGTNLGDGLRSAYYMLKEGDPNAEKYVVVMTDGMPSTYIKDSNGDMYFGKNGGSYKHDWPLGEKYAQLFADKLVPEEIPTMSKAYYVEFAKDAKKLWGISNAGESDNVVGVFKRALTADKMREVYQEIANELLGDISAAGIKFSEFVPNGLLVIDTPTTIAIDGYEEIISNNSSLDVAYKDGKLEVSLGDVIYELNGDYYTAPTYEFNLKIRPSYAGDFDFNGELAYTDIDGKTKVDIFNSDSDYKLHFNNTAIKDVKAIRVPDTNTINIEWQPLAGTAYGYHIYKEKQDGVIEKITTVKGITSQLYPYEIEGDDGGSTKFFVQGILTRDDQVNAIASNTQIQVNPNDSKELVYTVNWNEDPNASGYFVYEIDKNNAKILVKEFETNNVNHFEAIRSIDDSSSFVVESYKRTEETTSKGHVIGDTNPVITNFNVVRSNNSMLLSWDYLPNVDFSITPVINKNGTETDGTVINTTKLKEVVDNRVVYEYSISNPTSYTLPTDTIHFNLRGVKPNCTITPVESAKKNLQISVSIDFENTTPLVYGEQHQTTFKLKVADSLPENFHIYKPMIKIRFNAQENVDLPINISYPIVNVIGRGLGEGFSKQAVDVYENQWHEHTIYVALSEYNDSFLPAGEEIKVTLDYSMAFGEEKMSDATLQTIINDDKTRINSAFEIPFAFTQLLESFYGPTSTKANSPKVVSIDELLEVKVSLLYNMDESSDHFAPSSRDASLKHAEKFIRFKNEKPMDSEF